MSLRDALNSTAEAKAISTEQAEKRDAERKRVRDKMPDDVRQFADQVRSVFPKARLVAIRFEDGESIGAVM